MTSDGRTIAGAFKERPPVNNRPDGLQQFALEFHGGFTKATMGSDVIQFAKPLDQPPPVVKPEATALAALNKPGFSDKAKAAGDAVLNRVLNPDSLSMDPLDWGSFHKAA